jgi:glycosyltransferase involved in cell wall biosynthesis
MLMPDHPRISVIVPAHNSEAFIGQTLGSVRAQSLEDWECVVVDDGSRDQTCAVVEAVCAVDVRVRLVRQSCGGSSVARNRGFWESYPGSDFVTFMDADDLWEPEALATLVARLEECPGAVGAHGLGDFVDFQGSPRSPGAFSAFGRRRLGFRDGAIRVWPVDRPTVFDTLVWTCPLYPPGLLVVRRSAYEQSGMFDIGLRHCEDWDMCLRISRQGPLEFVDRVLLSYRRHASNQSNNHRASAESVRRLHHKTFFSPENSPEQQAMLKQGWKAWQLFRIVEKWQVFLDSLGRRSPTAAAQALASIPVYFVRYLRGYPSCSGI